MGYVLRKSKLGTGNHSTEAIQWEHTVSWNSKVAGASEFGQVMGRRERLQSESISVPHHEGSVG